MYRFGSEQGNFNAMQRLARCYYEGIGVEQNKEEAKRLYIEMSRKALELSRGVEWEEDGEIEWGFDESNGRLTSKRKENWRNTETRASHSV